MKKQGVDRKRNAQNMEVFKRMDTEMKRRNKIIQEAVDRQRDMVETENNYMAVQFVPKDFVRYVQLVQRLWKSKEEKSAEAATIRKGKTATETKRTQALHWKKQ